MNDACLSLIQNQFELPNILAFHVNVWDLFYTWFWFTLGLDMKSYSLDFYEVFVKIDK